MIKFLVIFILIFSSQNISAQKVIINGVEGNRLLQWSDFTGIPDYSSPYFAYTVWKTNYKYTAVRFSGETALINGFEMTLILDSTKSWSKKDKKSDDLLLHEQGHFDIGLLYMKDVLKEISRTQFTRANYQSEIRNLTARVHKKYNEMTLNYDSDTNHSKNKQQQNNWTKYFNDNLSR